MNLELIADTGIIAKVNNPKEGWETGTIERWSVCEN